MTDPQSDPDPAPPQLPGVDIDPTLSVLGATWKLKPIGTPFDAIPQFGALITFAASWNVTGPLSDKTHGFTTCVLMLAIACTLTMTLPLVPLQLPV
jgi:hypothetical protein